MNNQLLIVEDDEVFASALSSSMEKKGFSAIIAHDIESARQAAREFSPNFAIVDLKLGSESGLEVIPFLKQLNNKSKIVVLTGYASIATAVEAIKLGAIHYLTKPVSSREIFQAFFRDKGQSDQTLATNPLSLKRLEWEHIQKVLIENNGNLSAAARALGMHRRSLQRKLSKYPVKN